jgi:hypothetical protein
VCVGGDSVCMVGYVLGTVFVRVPCVRRGTCGGVLCGDSVVSKVLCVSGVLCGVPCVRRGTCMGTV